MSSTRYPSVKRGVQNRKSNIKRIEKLVSERFRETETVSGKQTRHWKRQILAEDREEASFHSFKGRREAPRLLLNDIRDKRGRKALLIQGRSDANMSTYVDFWIHLWDFLSFRSSLVNMALFCGMVNLKCFSFILTIFDLSHIVVNCKRRFQQRKLHVLGWYL